MHDLQRAATLYRGDLLIDMPPVSPVFDDWAQARRRHLSEKAGSAFSHLTSQLVDARLYGAAIATAHKMVQMDPLSEEYPRWVMRAHDAAGSRARALQHFKDCAKLLRTELGIAPSPETIALAREIEARIDPRHHEPHVGPVAANRNFTEGPSIVVIPFLDLSPDADQNYFADGIVEELTNALSRIKWLFVIARNSAFVYKDRNVDVRQISRDLGARYVLAGSIRKHHNKLRISTQLIEAETARNVWSDRFDGEVAEVFALQDAITESVVGAIEPTLRAEEISRARLKPTNSLDAYDLYLRALPCFYTMTKESFDEAVRLLDEAIAIDPAYMVAKAFAAFARGVRVNQGWSTATDNEIAVRLAREVVDRGGNDPTCLRLAGHVLGYNGKDIPAGLAAIERALKLNPNSSEAHRAAAWLHLYKGESARVHQHVDRAICLSPLEHENGMGHTAKALAHLQADEPERALEECRRALQLMPRYATSYRALIMTLWTLGKDEEARAAAKKLLAISPELTMSQQRRNTPFQDERFRELYHEALNAAGIPE